MNRPCKVKIECPGVDSPILNVSSEAPDSIIFVGKGYTPFDPYRPPALGSGRLYIARDCDNNSFSVLSQEIADLLAEITAQFCENDGAGLQFSNDAQTASVLCASGTRFFYTVPAGLFLGPVTPANPDEEAIEASVAAANAAALAYAQQQASAQLCCLTMSGSILCIAQPASGISFTAHSNQLGAVFGLEVVGGMLPPGVSFVQTGPLAAELQGVPTTLGAFTFQVRAFTVSSEIIETFTVTVQLCGVNIIHTGANPGWLCLGEELDPDLSSYQVTGLPSPTTDCTFVLLSGALPPGVTLEKTGPQTAELEGTPTATGLYSYTIQAFRTDLPSVQVQISETLAVFGIINPDLPDGTQGQAYSEQLQTGGGTAPVVFVALDAPPLGLTLQADGTLDGTPSASGLTGFVVQITDAEGKVCTQTCTVLIAASDCPDWANLLWGVKTENHVGAGSSFFSPSSAASASFNTWSNSPNGITDTASAINSATLAYNGPLCHCNLHIECTKIGPAAQLCGTVTILLGAIPGMSVDFNIVAAGTYDFPFDIPDTGGFPATINVSAFTQAPCLGLSAGQHRIELTATISNI